MCLPYVLNVLRKAAVGTDPLWKGSLECSWGPSRMVWRFAESCWGVAYLHSSLDVSTWIVRKAEKWGCIFLKSWLVNQAVTSEQVHIWLLMDLRRCLEAWTWLCSSVSFRSYKVLFTAAAGRPQNKDVLRPGENSLSLEVVFCRQLWVWAACGLHTAHWLSWALQPPLVMDVLCKLWRLLSSCSCISKYHTLVRS